MLDPAREHDHSPGPVADEHARIENCVWHLDVGCRLARIEQLQQSRVRYGGIRLAGGNVVYDGVHRVRMGMDDVVVVVSADVGPAVENQLERPLATLLANERPEQLEDRRFHHRLQANDAWLRARQDIAARLPAAGIGANAPTTVVRLFIGADQIEQLLVHFLDVRPVDRHEGRGEHRRYAFPEVDLRYRVLIHRALFENSLLFETLDRGAPAGSLNLQPHLAHHASGQGHVKLPVPGIGEIALFLLPPDLAVVELKNQLTIASLGDLDYGGVGNLGLAASIDAPAVERIVRFGFRYGDRRSGHRRLLSHGRHRIRRG